MPDPPRGGRAAVRRKPYPVSRAAGPAPPVYRPAERNAPAEPGGGGALGDNYDPAGPGSSMSKTRPTMAFDSLPQELGRPGVCLMRSAIDDIRPGGRRMARGSVQRFKAILLRFSLGCLLVPMCAALGSTQPCITPQVVVADPADVSAASQRDGCLDAAVAGGNLAYDASSARCVQGGGGCELTTI